MNCPECDATLDLLPDLEEGEIIVCGDCGVELEVTGLEPGALVVLADRRLPVPGGIGQYQARPTTAAGWRAPTPT